MLRKLDDRVLNYMGVRERASNINDYRRTKNDLVDRLQAGDYDGVSAAMADKLGGAESAFVDRLRGEDQGVIDDLIERAAMKRDPSLTTRFYGMMSSRDGMSRAGQAGVYGAMGGGVTLGLTAAGQGLMALMDYMQQGEQAAVQRNQELPS